MQSFWVTKENKGDGRELTLLGLELLLVQGHVMLSHVLLQARVVPVGFSAATHNTLVVNDVSL